MNGLVSTLRSRLFGVLPVWVLLLVIMGGTVWYVLRKDKTTGTTDSADAGTTSALDTNDLVNGLPSVSNTYITVTGTPGVITPPSQGGTTTTGTTTGTPAAPTRGTGTGGGAASPGPVSTRTGGTGTPAPSTGKQKSISYVVAKGDTLTSIAKRKGVELAGLEKANSTVLMNTARQHGYTGSDYDNYIYPGEKLVIPA